MARSIKTFSGRSVLQPPTVSPPSGERRLDHRQDTRLHRFRRFFPILGLRGGRSHIVTGGSAAESA